MGDRACIKHRIHFATLPKLIAYSWAIGKAELFVLRVLSLHGILGDYKCIWYIVSDQYVNGSSAMIHARQALDHWATSPTIYNLSPFALSILQASGEHTGPSTLPFESGSPTGLDLCGEVRNTPVTSFLRLGFEAHSTVPRFLYKFLDSRCCEGNHSTNGAISASCVCLAVDVLFRLGA